MSTICVLGDAHLLCQADWIEDERIQKDEVVEALENFQRAINEVSKESPDAVILAGDMFDTRTQSRQRVTHREAEKYMVPIRETLGKLADTGCKIFVLRGNHDSEPVLRSLEQSLSGKVTYPKKKAVHVGDLTLGFMDSHYVQGSYTVPSEDVPERADVLFMHESVPILNVTGPPKEFFSSLCKRFGIVFNGHMHFYVEQTLGIPNFYVLPAFIPSREIKGNWMVKYRYDSGQVSESKQKSPFGYVVYDGKTTKLRAYEPLQIVTRVELIGNSTDDFLKGIDKIYSLLMERKDRKDLRIWIRTNADRITVDRVLQKEVEKYSEIRTIDFETDPHFLTAPSITIQEEFRDVAFNRAELIEKISESLKGTELELARRMFNEILTPEFLMNRNPEERAAFRRLLEIVSEKYEVSDAFAQRAWNLAKESYEK